MESKFNKNCLILMTVAEFIPENHFLGLQQGNVSLLALEFTLGCAYTVLLPGVGGRGVEMLLYPFSLCFLLFPCYSLLLKAVRGHLEGCRENRDMKLN
jgi:hypothetical protein